MTSIPPEADQLEIAAPDCVAEDFDGEIVVVNLNSGHYFSIQGLGAAVWRDLVAGHRVSTVRAGLTGFSTDLVQPVAHFIATLVDNQLLRPAQNVAPPPGPPGCFAAAQAGATTLSLEAYDDMKDLLLTDPIHDVDPEVGWPVRRKPE